MASDEEKRRLIQSLEEFLAAAGRQAARLTCTLHLTTSDGATRMIQWQGPPPRELRLPCKRRARFVDTGEAIAIPAHPLERVYVLLGSGSRPDVFRYEEASR